MHRCGPQAKPAVALARPMGRLPWRDATVLVAVAAMWGFNFVPIRWALDEVPPFALAAVRFLAAAVPAVFLVRRPQIPLRLLVGYGLAIGVGQFGLLFLALRLGFPAGLASLLMQVQVMFTIGLAAVVTRDRIAPRQAVGAAIALIGIVVLVAARGVEGVTAAGLAIVLAAAACWAVGNVVAKVASRRHGADVFGLVVWSSLVSPLPLAALSFTLEGGFDGLATLSGASLRAWSSILFMAYGATLFGFGVWNRLLHRHDAAVVTPFALLIPIAGLGSAALFLGEELHWIEAVAASLVLAGLAVVLLGGRLTKRSAAVPASSPD